MTSLAVQSSIIESVSAPDSVRWGCHDSPLGPLLIGVTDRGVCRLECASPYGLRYDIARWQQEWPLAELIPDAGASAMLASQFRALAPYRWSLAPLALYGTAFQLKVWKAMLQLEPGRVMSYADVAALIGKPGAARAVSMAVEANPVPLLTPCAFMAENNAPSPPHWRDMPRKVVNG